MFGLVVIFSRRDLDLDLNLNLDLGCDRAPATDHAVRLDLGSSEPGVRWLHGCYHYQSITVWDLELLNGALSIGLYFLEDDLQIDLLYTGSIVQTRYFDGQHNFYPCPN